MASENNLKAAQDTYAGFLNFLKYGSIAVAVVAAIVILLIS